MAVIRLMADDPPNLTVASETQPYDLEKAKAERDLAWDTRELAANILRIIRGAGNPSHLPQQIINLSGAILETHKAARAWAIWSAMEDALRSGVPHPFDGPDSDAYESTIARGALQLVASTLVSQRAQAAAGGREIDEGIRELEQCRERLRKQCEQERARASRDRAVAVSRKRRKPTQKPKLPDVAAPPKELPIEVVKEERPASTAEFMKARQRAMRREPKEP